MYVFLFLLLIGFAFNLASTFTAAYSRRWGERTGTRLTILFRDILGIPVWAAGFGLAALVDSTAIFRSTLMTALLGWLLVAVGGVIICAALYTIRTRAAAPSTRDALARTGLYARVRHPIHSGTLLEFAGLFLILPTWPVVLACVIGVAWIFAQTWLEERDLLQRIPGYREYMEDVPRFLPRPGKK